MHNVLLVEDEMDIQFANKIILERRGGYNVSLAMNIAEAWQRIAESEPALIVLDIMLPDGSGLDFIKKLRQKKNIPVLFLTALSESGDELRGIQSGGDDYMTKPYDNNILLARINMILRRTFLIPGELVLGSIKIETAPKRAYVNDVDMGLMSKEFSLLEQFVQHPEKVMHTDDLYEKIWAQKMHGDDKALRTTISRLRTKLHEMGAGYTIISVRGEGYCFSKAG